MTHRILHSLAAAVPVSGRVRRVGVSVLPLPLPAGIPEGGRVLHSDLLEIQLGGLALILIISLLLVG